MVASLAGIRAVVKPDGWLILETRDWEMLDRNRVQVVGTDHHPQGLFSAGQAGRTKEMVYRIHARKTDGEKIDCRPLAELFGKDQGFRKVGQ